MKITLQKTHEIEFATNFERMFMDLTGVAVCIYGLHQNCFISACDLRTVSAIYTAGFFAVVSQCPGILQLALFVIGNYCQIASRRSSDFFVTPSFSAVGNRAAEF